MILWVIALPKLVITKKQTLTYNAQKSRIPTTRTRFTCTRVTTGASTSNTSTGNLTKPSETARKQKSEIRNLYSIVCLLSSVFCILFEMWLWAII